MRHLNSIFLFIFVLFLSGCSSKQSLGSAPVYTNLEGDWVLKDTSFGDVGFTFKINPAPAYTFSIIDRSKGQTLFFECKQDLGDGLYAYSVCIGMKIKYHYLILKDSGMRIFAGGIGHENLSDLIRDQSRAARLMAVRE